MRRGGGGKYMCRHFCTMCRNCIWQLILRQKKNNKKRHRTTLQCHPPAIKMAEYVSMFAGVRVVVSVDVYVWFECKHYLMSCLSLESSLFYMHDALLSFLYDYMIWWVCRMVPWYIFNLIFNQMSELWAAREGEVGVGVDSSFLNLFWCINVYICLCKYLFCTSSKWFSFTYFVVVKPRRVVEINFNFWLNKLLCVSEKDNNFKLLTINIFLLCNSHRNTFYIE